MGLFSSKKVSLPPTPTFTRNPYTNEIISLGLNTGRSFVNQDSSLSPSLQEAISTNPQVTKLMLEGLRGTLDPMFRDRRSSVIADLEANNQLTGSTTANALGNLEADYMGQLTAAGAEAGINDINRALAARLNLAQLGLGALGTAGNQALTDQGQENNFNLSNYENIVAKTLAEQKPEKGGLMGALTGGLGGAMGGAMFGPMGMLAGGLLGAVSGGFGPQGTGGSFLSTGAGLMGNKMGADALSKFNPGTIAIPSGQKEESINDLLRNAPDFRFGLMGALG